MDIKNRLIGIKRPVTGKKNPEEQMPKLFSKMREPETSVIFNENSTVVRIITEEINAMNNIIFVCDKTCNRKSVAGLLKNYVRRNIVVNFPRSKEEYAQNAINIIPEASGKDIVSVAEAVLSGVNSFVAGINLNSYTDFDNKIKTLIALNSDLDEKFINILFNVISPVFVNIKLENGICTVAGIDKVEYSRDDTVIKNLYSYDNDNSASRDNIQKISVDTKADSLDKLPKPEQTVVLSEKEVNSEVDKENQKIFGEEDIVNADLSKNEIMETAETEKVECENFEKTSYSEFEEAATHDKDNMSDVPEVTADDTENVQKQSVVNKYKLLREKARRKKIEERSAKDEQQTPPKEENGDETVFVNEPEYKPEENIDAIPSAEKPADNVENATDDENRDETYD